MNIAGKFGIVSDTDYRQGIVLVGFTGNAYPHDLTQKQISYIKAFYNMENCAHEICGEWPQGIEPRYPAAKTNFKNGFILLTKEKKHEDD